MDWFVRAFIKSSLAWLAAGVTIGLAMALYPPLAVYRLAHLHLNLLGFVVQIIYGVSMHVVPRFFGQPLVYRRMAEAQYWLAQAGVVLLVTGFTLRVPGITGATVCLIAGALASAGIVRRAARSSARCACNALSRASIAAICALCGCGCCDATCCSCAPAADALVGRRVACRAAESVAVAGAEEPAAAAI